MIWRLIVSVALGCCISSAELLLHRGSAWAAGAADETRLISAQVLPLIRSSRFTEAEPLAKKGLALCNDVGDVKVFCASQFNEFLGDIAFGLNQYEQSVDYHLQALAIRKAGLSNGHPLTGRSALRVGKSYLALKRYGDAAVFILQAVDTLGRTVPVNTEFATSLGYLRKLYLETDRLDDAVETARRELDAYVRTEDKSGSSPASARQSLSAILSMRATKSTSQNKYADSERDLLEAIRLLDPPPPNAEKTFGSLQSQLGSLYERQQRHAEAEQHLLRSLDYHTRAGGSNDRDILVVLANLCQTYMKLEKPAEAAAYGIRAISGFDEKQIEDSTLGHALLSVGRAEIKLGRLPDAEPHLVRALQVLDRVLAETDLQRISVRLELGALWVNQKRYDDAEALYESGLAIEQKRASADATWRATLLAARGSAYTAQGRLAEAELSLSEAIRIEEKAGPDREVILGQRLVALAAVLKQTNRYADTETVLLQARNAMDRALPETDARRISIRHELGLFWLEHQRFELAEESFKSALAIDEKRSSSDTRWRSSLLAGLGLAYRDGGKIADANRLLSEALHLEEAAGSERKFDLADRLIALASILRRQGAYAEAEAALTRALSIELEPLVRATALNSLGLIYESTGRYARAEPLLNEALEIRTNRLPPTSSLIVETITNLATLDYGKGNFAASEAKLRQALDVTSARVPQQPLRIALQSSLLAQTLIAEGKVDEAERLADDSLRLYRERLEPGHPRIAVALRTVASLEAARGRDQQAERHVREALTIDEKFADSNGSAVAGDLVALARIVQRAGKLKAAKADAARALSIIVAQYGEESVMNTEAMYVSADIAYAEGKYAEARQFADRAMRIQGTPGTADYPMLGSLLFAAQLDMAEGRLDDASKHLDGAARIAATLPAEHFGQLDVLEGKANLARASANLVDVEIHDRKAMELVSNLEPGHPRRQLALDRLVGDLWRKGKYADAQELRRNELAAMELKLAPEHPAIATALRGLAAVLGGSAQHDEALKLYQRALAIDKSAFGFPSDQTSIDHFGIGLVLRNLGRMDEARAEIRVAQEGWNGIDRILSGSAALEQLALLSLDQNAVAEGVVLMERRLGIAEELLGADSPALIPVVATLAGVYLVSGQLDLARQCLVRSEALAGSGLRPDGPNYLVILQLRAFISAQSGDLAAAERQLKEALEIIARRENNKASAVGSNLANLATVYLYANRLQDAIAAYAEALDILRREPGPRSPIVGYCLALASEAYSRAGDQATAKTLLDAAVEILGPGFLAQHRKQRWL